MKIEEKNYLYLNFCKLLYEVSIQDEDGVDISLILKGFLQRKSTELQVSQSELISLMSKATTVVRRKMVIALVLLEEEIEKEKLDKKVPMDATNQYRYSLANIQEFYAIFARRNISRQALNKHKREILQSQNIPNEYTSVLEVDLIEYFYSQTGVMLDIEKIRPLAYKKPLIGYKN